MNQALKEKCDLLVGNRATVTNAFKWSPELMTLAAAGILTSAGMQADAETLEKCEAIIKGSTSAFSSFRANVKIPVICKMAIAESPEAYFKKLTEVYDLFGSKPFYGDEYQILAAITICDRAKDIAEAAEFVEKTNAVYAKMKECHRFLTSNEDLPFAAMIAVSGIDIQTAIDEAEAAYSVLKDEFSDNNAVQTLSHVLALDAAKTEEKCGRVCSIFEELKEQKHKFGTGYELSSLGALISLDLGDAEIAALIIEADEYLKEHKGFGDFALGSKERRMVAAQTVAFTLCGNTKADSLMLNSLLSITLTIELCLYICMINSVL